MKWLSLVVLSLLLVGCKSDLNKSAENAKDQLVGASQDRVAQCMGLPHRTGVVSGYEIWEYSTGNESIKLPVRISATYRLIVGKSLFLYLFI